MRAQLTVLEGPDEAQCLCPANSHQRNKALAL